ncbi:SGNH/GDSL hydrolase family protein [Paenibacillus sp. 2KB_22]|uniref:SGNH/GDSL hydrolase family protein n=1 Tax=Paenibacillus sp. 2KB_22 TaxID=3232978 RepID=UPI003F9AB3E9
MDGMGAYFSNTRVRDMGFRSLASPEGESAKNNIQSNGVIKVSSTPNQIEPTKDTDSQTEETSSSAAINGEGVTVIGDSVMVGVEPYLKEKLPRATVNGKVGRQMSQAKKLLEDLRKQGELGDHIIIELGTNGPFTKDQFRSLLASLSEAKKVLVVTTRVPKRWQNTVNSNIKDVVSEFENAKVVDWYTASTGKDDYFYKDGVHLKPDGSRFYASLLVQALQEK